MESCKSQQGVIPEESVKWVVVQRRLLRAPWTARRSNQSIPKEINPEYSLGGLRLKLKLQYFGHLMQRADSSENILMLGKIEGRRRMGWQRVRRLDGTTDSMDMNLNKLRELVMNREAWRATVHGISKSQTWLNGWTELNWICFKIIKRKEERTNKISMAMSWKLLLLDEKCIKAHSTTISPFADTASFSYLKYFPKNIYLKHSYLQKALIRVMLNTCK